MAGEKPGAPDPIALWIDEFRSFVEKRSERLTALAAQRKSTHTGSGIIGYMSTTTPVEILHAFGFHPVRLLGSREGITEAGAKLQSFACTIARSVLDQGLTGKFHYLAGIVIPRNTCDSVLHLADIWERSITTIPVYSIAQPVRHTGEAVQRFYSAELEAFSEALANATKKKLPPGSLRKSIETYGENRALLQKLQILRMRAPALLPFSSYYLIVIASQLMPVEEHTQRLKELLKVLDTTRTGPNKHPGTPKEQVPLVVCGGMVEGTELFEWLEACGGMVVADETSFGSRAIETTIDLDNLGSNADLQAYSAAIAKAYLGKTPDPTRFDSGKQREAKLLGLVKTTGAKGVVFIHQQFCESYAFDYVLLEKRLKEMNIPSLLIEIEHQLSNLGQLKTKLQTFVEMLK